MISNTYLGLFSKHCVIKENKEISRNLEAVVKGNSHEVCGGSPHTLISHFLDLINRYRHDDQHAMLPDVELARTKHNPTANLIRIL